MNKRRIGPFLKAEGHGNSVTIRFTRFYWVHPSFWREVVRARRSA